MGLGTGGDEAREGAALRRADWPRGWCGGGFWCGGFGFALAPGQLEQGQGEKAEDRAQDGGDAGDRGEEFRGAGLGEKHFDLEAPEVGVMAVVAEVVDEPAPLGREVLARWRAGGAVARAGTRGVRTGRAASMDAGGKALDPLAGAADAGAEEDEEGGENRVTLEAVVDDEDETGENRGEAAGEFQGEGAGRIGNG